MEFSGSVLVIAIVDTLSVDGFEGDTDGVLFNSCVLWNLNGDVGDTRAIQYSRSGDYVVELVVQLWVFELEIVSVADLVSLDVACGEEVGSDWHAK